MSAPTIEERLNALEQEVARIRSQFQDRPSALPDRTRPDFLDNYVGLSPDTPMFAEMVRHVEEERERGRREAQGEADAEDTPI